MSDRSKLLQELADAECKLADLCSKRQQRMLAAAASGGTGYYAAALQEPIKRAVEEVERIQHLLREI
jgi:protein-L-isoaspartate O-methyltransferase